MCVKEFLAFPCGHCSIPIIRPCPIACSQPKVVYCSIPAERPDYQSEYCHGCNRVVWNNDILKIEGGHKAKHMRGECAMLDPKCETIFPEEREQRMHQPDWHQRNLSKKPKNNNMERTAADESFEGQSQGKSSGAGVSGQLVVAKDSGGSGSGIYEPGEGQRGGRIRDHGLMSPLATPFQPASTVKQQYRHHNFQQLAGSSSGHPARSQQYEKYSPLTHLGSGRGDTAKTAKTATTFQRRQSYATNSTAYWIAPKLNFAQPLTQYPPPAVGSPSHAPVAYAGTYQPGTYQPPTMASGQFGGLESPFYGVLHAAAEGSPSYSNGPFNRNAQGSYQGQGQGNKHNQTNAMSSYGPGNGYFIPQTHAGQPGAGMKFYASDTNDNSRNPPIPTENAALDLNRYYPTPTYQMYGHGRSKSESYDPAAAHATAVGYNTSIDGRIEAHRGAELASGLTPEDFRDSDDEMQDREVDSSSYHERELVAENEESADSNEGDEEGNSSEEFNENYALCSGKDEAPVSSGMRSAKSADKGKGKAKK